MFICDPCLTSRYQNGPSITKSTGPCEICGNTMTCNDIPSGQLRQAENTTTGEKCHKCGDPNNSTFAGDKPTCTKCYVIHFHREGEQAGQAMWDECVKRAEANNTTPENEFWNFDNGSG